MGGGPAFLVALAMAELSDAHGEVVAGIRALAELCGYGKSTVHRAIVTAGLFKMTDRGGGTRPAVYRFAYPQRDAKAVDNVARNGSSVPTAGHKAPRLSHTSDLASSPRDTRRAHKELKPKTLKPRDTRVTKPEEIPSRVNGLRSAMGGPK